MVHRAVNGRISVHCHVISCHKENTTSPYSRGTSSLNFSTIVWCEISKLVKSVLSYLLMLHPPPTESPRIVDNFILEKHVVLSVGFTPSQKSVRKQWKDHRPTWVWTPMLWSPWYLADPLQRTNLQGLVPVNEKWTSSVTYPRTSHQIWKLRKS